MRATAFAVALPVLLMGAAVAAGLTANLTELAILAASFAGVAMILCALSLMGVAASAVGALGLAGHGAALAALGLSVHADAALWLMAAALPLEAWFVFRKPVAAALGGVAGALILAAFAVAQGAVAGGSLAAAAVLVLYGASLAARIKSAAPVAVETAAAQAEAALPAGDVRFRLDREGVAVEVSAETARRLGLKPQMLEGAALLDRVHVADRVAYLTLLAGLRAGSAARPVELRLRASEGGTVAFRAYRMEGFVQDGGVTLVGRSLADEKKLRDEIDALKAELEAEKLARGRMLAAVSHELRTPLNSIIGFSDMLAHEVGCRLETGRQREYAGLIRQSGHYLLELVNAVMDSARLETGAYRIAPQPFVFRDAVEMCASVMLPQAEKKGVAFCHRVGAGVGELTADKRAVQQILLNLAANAVKFTPAGGCVTIDAARVAGEGGAAVEFSVSDTGVGIEPEDLARIGMPFVRADNSYTRAQEGSGLGLSVVRGLVELHGGTMRLSSRPGEGTVVTVRLPAAQPESENRGEIGGDNPSQEPGAVIDMHRHQGERRDERQEIREQDDAQARKTA